MTMRISTMAIVAGAAALAACGQANQPAEASADVAAAKLPAKKVPYCFFKDENSKGWAASAGKDGNVRVSGKAYVADGRYMAGLKPPEIQGSTASVQLAMPQNDTGHSKIDGWWDVSSILPASGSVDTVKVLCGAKTVASLDVKRKG
jgi:hypothetical protein